MTNQGISDVLSSTNSSPDNRIDIDKDVQKNKVRIITPQIKPPVLPPIPASQYLGIDTDKDALKSSRSTGILWGVKAPEFLKCGRKILYRVETLDKWLEQFQGYTNNAQV